MKPRLACAALGALALLAGCGTGGDGNFSQPTKSLEVVSWWTSGSETAALKVLVDRFQQADPGVMVESAGVEGGAGSNVQIALAERLRNGNPPDVWQTLAGASLRAYAQSERIADVTSVFEKDKLAGAIPAPVLDAVTWKGKRWGMPTGAHRQNMLWFNPAVLKAAGVALPTSGYTMDRLVADLGALKQKGAAPLCLGAKDRFTTIELFEDILLGDIGPQGWTNIATDKFDWNGAAVRRSLDRLGRLLDFADTSTPRTWDEAAKRLAEGKCAFLAMNDSLYGELVADGVVAADIGYVAFPGTEGTFLAVIDTFVVARDSKNGFNALQFLAIVGAPSKELDFAKAKGSAPLRTDVDVASLPAYQQAATSALRADKLLLSITHGELLDPFVQQAVYDGVAAFARSRDPEDFSFRFQQIATGTVPTGH